MAREGRSRTPMAVVLITIAAAVGLLAGPTAALGGVPGPLAAIDFIDAWTNDDGSGNDGDDGGPAGSYDHWGPASSADPMEAGPGAARTDKDVGKCTAAVRAADPNYVDVTVLNGYPGYVCTVSVVVENASVVTAQVHPAASSADPGLTVADANPQLPVTLGPGEQGEAAFSIAVEQSAPRWGPGSDTLKATVLLVFTAEYGRILVDKVTDAPGSPLLFEFEPSWGDNFFLADEDPPHDSGPLIPGSYSLTEVDLPPDWVLIGASCVIEGDPDPTPMDPAEITVGPGETALCTFENFDTGQLFPEPSLTIVKNARPADGTVFYFGGTTLPDFSLSPPAVSSKQFTSLKPGLYTIVELTGELEEGWQFEKVECIATDWTAAGATVAVNLGEGEAAVCTFYNAKELPATGASIWLLMMAAAGLAALLTGLFLVGRSRRREEDGRQAA